MHNREKISVIVVWDKKIEELLITIKSIFEQKYSNLEIIIVDITGSDSSVSEAERALSGYNNIIYLNVNRFSKNF